YIIMLQDNGLSLSDDIRKRVYIMLKQDISPSIIAKNLMISRSSVYRFKELIDKTDDIPQPKPSGGYRWSKLKKKQILALGKLLSANPKLTIQELKHLAIQKKIIFLDISDITIYKAIQKLGFHHKHATYYDPKTTTDPIILLEKQLFME